MFLSLAFIHVFLLRQAQCFKTTHHFWNAYMPARHQALSSWPLRSSISDKEARETAETARARFPHLGDPLGIPNEVDADEMPTSTFVSYLKPQAEPLDICAAVALCLKDSSNLSRARDLLSIGAVWSYENRSSIVKSQGNSINPNNSTKDGAGKWRRVRFDSSSGAVLASGTALRVYGTPRRFLGCYVGDWRSRLLHTDSAYVVVDKPPKLPCQPDNANLAESLPACTLRALAPLLAPKSSKKKLVSEETVRPLELLLVHRLDTNTEGCTVLARNRKAQAQFKQWLSSRKVTKEYVCLSRGQRLGQGLKRHWMLSPGPSSSSSDDMSYDQVVGPGPRLLRKTAPPPVSAQASPLTSSPSPNRKKASKGKGKPKDDLSLAPCPAPLGLSWKPCTLEVLSCEPFNFGSSSSFSSDGLEDGTSSATGEKLFETRVRLLTGRTHQVRAQFAAMGAPLYGDTAYAPQRGMTLDSAAVDLDDCNAWLSAAHAALHAAETAPVVDASASATMKSSDVTQTLQQPRTLAAFLTARRLESLKSNEAIACDNDESVVEASTDATIALQAARIAFAGRDVHCRPPWWRREPSR